MTTIRILILAALTGVVEAQTLDQEGHEILETKSKLGIMGLKVSCPDTKCIWSSYRQKCVKIIGGGSCSDYVENSGFGNECEGEGRIITSKSDCEKAASDLGDIFVYGGSTDKKGLSNRPPGCFTKKRTDQRRIVYFNEDSTGKNPKGSRRRLICTTSSYDPTTTTTTPTGRGPLVNLVGDDWCNETLEEGAGGADCDNVSTGEWRKYCEKKCSEYDNQKQKDAEEI